MPQIDFRDNKVLKLTNVLSRQIPPKELFSQDKQLLMLTNWIKAKGYQTVGPLIIYSKGIVGMDTDGTPLIDTRIMIQLREGIIVPEPPYEFWREIRVSNCLFARFHDESEKIQFATNKLTLYAYENDLELTGETYTVMVKQIEKIATADIFMPIKSKA